MKFSRLSDFFERLGATTKRLEMFDVLAELMSEAQANEIAPITYMLQGQLLPPFKGLEFGISEKILLRTLSDTSGLPSAQIEAVFHRTGDLGATALECLSGSGEMEVAAVYDELMNIARTSGKGSVDQKTNLLASLLRGVSPREAVFITRFVHGRLRLGVGDQTILDALAQVATSRALGLPLQAIPGAGLKSAQRMELFNSMALSQEVLAEVDAATEGVTGNKRAAMYFQSLMQRRKAVREGLERAYNLCSDLGRVANRLMADGLDAVKKFSITVGYPIRMALCERVPTSAGIIEKMGRAAVEAKYDGLRLQIHKDGTGVEIFSRNLERMSHMFPEIVEGTASLKTETLIIEGEALAYNEDTGELLPFQATMQRKRKHNIADKQKEFPLRFFGFELLFINGEDYTVRPYMERRERLVALLKGASEAMVPAQMFLTDDPAEIDRHFEEFIETGLEGIVAKKLDSPYSAGARDFNWIKLKRSYRGELADSVDLCVVGYYRGKGSRARFGIGALLGAVYDPESDSFKTVTRIGSGFTEDELVRLKSILDESRLGHRHPRVDSVVEADVWVEPRYVITVTADEITRSPSHTAGVTESDPLGYALRFPRAVGFLRQDKRAEDANTVDEIISLERLQKKVKIT